MNSKQEDGQFKACLSNTERFYPKIKERKMEMSLRGRLLAWNVLGPGLHLQNLEVLESKIKMAVAGLHRAISLPCPHGRLATGEQPCEVFIRMFLPFLRVLHS